MLFWFEVVTGRRVNLNKSEMSLVIEVTKLEYLATIMRCKVSALPKIYMGLPLAANFKATSVWIGLI